MCEPVLGEIDKDAFLTLALKVSEDSGELGWRLNALNTGQRGVGGERTAFWVEGTGRVKDARLGTWAM